MERFLICLFDKLLAPWIVDRSRMGITTRFVLLNKRGLNGCGRTGAIVEVCVSIDGSVIGS